MQPSPRHLSLPRHPLPADPNQDPRCNPPASPRVTPPAFHVPILSRCLLNAAILVRRRLTIESLLAAIPTNASNVLFLFPPTVDQASIALSSIHGSTDLHLGGASVLTAFDATWKQAKEIVRASGDCLKKVSAVWVCLGGDYREDVEGGSMNDGEETLAMRKEPREEYVSTMEAVTRALGTVEYGGGAEVEGSLIGVLREMVGLKRRFLNRTKPRVRIEEEEEAGR